MNSRQQWESLCQRRTEDSTLRNARLPDLSGHEILESAEFFRIFLPRAWMVLKVPLHQTGNRETSGVRAWESNAALRILSPR
jgi:hypothetical protein